MFQLNSDKLMGEITPGYSLTGAQHDGGNLVLCPMGFIRHIGKSTSNLTESGLGFCNL